MTKSLFWLIIIIVGIGLIISANIFRDKEQKIVANLEGPKNVSSPNPQEGSNQPSQSPSTSPLLKNLPKNASCKISGSIEFVNKNIYQTKGARIEYQNVDDKIRQIFWTSNPNDGVLAVGPNLFEQLEIPNGEKEIGVALNKDPQIDIYTLTAAINYGIKKQDGGEEVKVVNCLGEIKVDVSKAR